MNLSATHLRSCGISLLRSEDLLLFPSGVAAANHLTPSAFSSSSPRTPSNFSTSSSASINLLFKSSPRHPVCQLQPQRHSADASTDPPYPNNLRLATSIKKDLPSSIFLMCFFFSPDDIHTSISQGEDDTPCVTQPGFHCSYKPRVVIQLSSLPAFLPDSVHLVSVSLLLALLLLIHYICLQLRSSGSAPFYDFAAI